MSRILVGTSGFYYRDWQGVFYPQTVKKEAYLSFYAEHFQALELNFSYYRIPSARQSEQMLEKAKGRLEFVVKAYREITHEISPRSVHEILPQFMEGISPFFEAGKLGAILLQFPQAFRYLPHTRRYLGSLLESLTAYPVSVEFRHQEWLKSSVYQSLEELNTGLVCVDEPSLPSLVPPTVTATSRIGYIRFHGRNKKNWYKGDSISRYDYLYSEEEIKEWLPKINELASKTEKCFVFFNNHTKSQAVTNAKMLLKLLKDQA
jgi:uncharacterized protein YecE (DUF72 family)